MKRDVCLNGVNAASQHKNESVVVSLALSKDAAAVKRGHQVLDSIHHSNLVLESPSEERLQVDTKQAQPAAEDGLIGRFGHKCTHSTGKLHFQFRVLRKMAGQRYMVQFYSWVDGRATTVGVMSEEELLDQNVTLYTDAESWSLAAEKASGGQMDDSSKMSGTSEQTDDKVVVAEQEVRN